MIKRLISILVVLGGVLVGCSKPEIDIKGGLHPVEDFVVPSELRLTVGDTGTFEVTLKPANATEDKIISLTSSSPEVLSVSFSGLVVTYEALAPGSVSVEMRIGSVTKTFAVYVTSPDGDEKDNSVEVVVSGCKMEILPSIRTLGGNVEPGSVKVSVLSGHDRGNYVIACSVDDVALTPVSGVFVGQSRSISMDSGLELGPHKVVVEVREENNMTEPAFLEGTLWVKGPALTDYSVEFVSDFDLASRLCPETGVSLAEGEKGMMLVRHSPGGTPVGREYETPGFLWLDFDAATSGDGLLSVPFTCLAAQSGTMSVTFVNGDERYVVSGEVDGMSSRPLAVKDYSVPRDMKLSLAGGSQEYSVVTTPANCYKPEITSLKSSDEEVLTVSHRDLTLIMTPHYKGKVIVTVVLSGVEKSFEVEVTGDVVTDVNVPSSMELVMGESAEVTVGVTPMGALDASISELSSTNESVLTVKHEGLVLTLTGKAKGEARVGVTVGKIRKEIAVKVLSDEVSDFRVPEDLKIALGGGAQTYVFETTPAHPSNGTITRLVSSDESVVKVSYVGLTATFTPVYVGTATIGVTIGAVEKTFQLTVTGDVVTDFSIPMDLSLLTGETKSVSVSVVPLGALDGRVESVSSSDESVLLVAIKGGLEVSFTGVKMGTASVTIKVGKVTKRFTVKVLGKYVEDFTVPTDFQVSLGSPRSYLFDIKPEDAVDKDKFEVKSSDASVLKVEKSGGLTAQFTGVYPGSASVSVTIGSKTKTMPVTVVGDVVKDFTVPSGLTVERTKTADYVVSVSPANALDRNDVSVSSSAPDVVSVVNTGLSLRFEGKKIGKGTITLRIGRKTKTFEVGVTPHLVTDFTVPVDLTVPMLTSKTYDIVAQPSDADDISIVSVKSSDTSVLKVSSSGMRLTFEGVNKGTATVNVKVGTVEKSFAVSVSGRYVSDFSVPRDQVVEVGKTASFTFVPSQSGCLDASIVSIVSSDPGVVAVSGSGLTATFTGKYVGSVLVSVKVGSVTKTFDVKCIGSVATGVSIPSDLAGKSFCRGKSYDFVIGVTPSDAFDAGTLKVTSRDPGICTVTSLGGNRFRFTPKEFGTATFAVSVGRYSTSFSLKVIEHVELVAKKTSYAWNEKVEIDVKGDYESLAFRYEGEAFERSYSGTSSFKHVYVDESNVGPGKSGKLVLTWDYHELQHEALGEIIVVTKYGEETRLPVTVLPPSGRADCSVSRMIDDSGEFRVVLTIVNGSDREVTFTRFGFYISSGDGWFNGGNGNSYVYFKAMEHKPFLLYSDGKVFARYIALSDPNSYYRSISPFSTYTVSWTLSEDGDDFGDYDLDSAIYGEVEGIFLSNTIVSIDGNP